MKILIDADACPKPVLQICRNLGSGFGVEVWTVASFDHSIDSDHHIVVSNDPQESDIRIINMAEEGDVVITHDWGLAAIVLGKGATALGPTGRMFHGRRMEFLLEEREIKRRVRQGGGRTKGPRRRAIEDDRRFESTLERILLKATASEHTDREGDPDKR
jgi:uncharacterized protein YaiI (UPF0178 family)